MKISLAGCILQNNSGEILLLHRKTSRYDQWEIPGGKVEEGETAAQAAGREAAEELGVAVYNLRQVAVTHFTLNSVTYEYTYYVAQTQDEPRVAEPETFCELTYVDPHAALQPDMTLSAGAEALFALLTDGTLAL